MCSCVIESNPFIQQSYSSGHFYERDCWILSPKRDFDRLSLSVFSAPPALGLLLSHPSSSTNSSLFSETRRRYDVALNILLKKHENQFKMPKSMSVNLFEKKSYDIYVCLPEKKLKSNITR